LFLRPLKKFELKTNNLKNFGLTNTIRKKITTNKNKNDMNLTENKRILILGTWKQCLTNLGMFWVKNKLPTKNRDWVVISSYKDCIEKWSNSGISNVKQVFSYQDVKDEKNNSQIDMLKNENDVPLIIDQVIAKSFFKQDWVRRKFQFQTNLILITNNPKNILDKDYISFFDTILIGKTNTEDLLTQYHTLYVNNDSYTCADFRLLLKSLKDDEYISIVENITPYPVYSISNTDKNNSSSNSSDLSPPKNSTDEAKNLSSSNSSLKSTSSSKSKNTTSSSISTLSSNSTLSATKKTRGPSLKSEKEELSDLWISFDGNSQITNDLKDKDNNKNDNIDVDVDNNSTKTHNNYSITVKLLKDLALFIQQNQVIKDMIITLKYDEHESHAVLKVTLVKSKQDLFVCLMLNYFQGLKNEHLINHASIRI